MRRLSTKGTSAVQEAAGGRTGKGQAMLSSARTPYDLLREHVEALMETGEHFADVERAIDAADLPEDDRAALWLFAWSLADRCEPRPAEPGRPALHLVAEHPLQ